VFQDSYSGHLGMNLTDFIKAGVFLGLFSFSTTTVLHAVSETPNKTDHKITETETNMEPPAALWVYINRFFWDLSRSH